jgi:orotidine-5'-phosphate decarboxylase
MIIDRLYESVEKKGNVCVGLDTAVEYIPESFRLKFNNIEDALFEFNKRIIDAAYDYAACFKVQIAYYEALGLKGLEVYKRTLEYIRNSGAIVIADIKRGDIAATAQMYAKAHFEGDFESDLITLSPYMGMDSLEPYLPYVKSKEKGIFVLVRTSNRGAADIQYIEDSKGEKVYRHTGDKLYEMSKEYMGNCGYSSIGGVVGCTHIDEGIELRERFKNMFFLIPGYGAQGGAANDVAIYLRGGNGGVVNSSRGILLAYKNHSEGEKKFDEYARSEVLRMREDILDAVRIQESKSI